MKIILKIVIVAIALMIASKLFSGIQIDSFSSAIIAAIFFGILNLFIAPILKLFALPINFLTLGLFDFIINALIFWMITVLDGVTISGFWTALFGSIVVTIVKNIGYNFIDNKKDKKKNK